jgi:tetratricopeptide (TPR) repeat protein
MAFSPSRYTVLRLPIEVFRLRRLVLAPALCVVVLSLSAFFFQASQKTSSKQQLMRANNLGVAYMNQQKLDQALKEFEQAVAIDKNNPTAQLNLGIAELNLSHVAPSEAALQRAAQLDPKNPAVWYNLGLLHRNNGQADEALAELKKAAELAHDDPDTHYFLGDLYSQQQKYADAEREFRRAAELDPFNVSAEFGLARALQRQGKTADAKPHFERFQKLTREKLGSPISQIYGEQGPLSLAKVIPGEPVVPPAIPVRFTEMGSGSGLPVGRVTVGSKQYQSYAPMLAPGYGICVFDLDEDGLPDILITGQLALYKNLGGGKFTDVTKDSGLGNLGAMSCAVGDYDNDGKPDIALITKDGVRLYHNEGALKFVDKTKEAHIQVENPTSLFATPLVLPVTVTFVDYDHDGDLDLFVTRSEATDVLLRNNGDGTFTDVTERTAMQGNGAGAMVASDINNDRAIDLILTSTKS